MITSRVRCGVVFLFLAPVHFAGAVGGMDVAPSPAPALHKSVFAQPKETRLENGLRVIVAERPGLPLIAAELLVRTGAEIDLDGQAGAASMTASLLTKGTEKMSAPEIASAIESLGGAIESGARWDSSSAAVVVMSSKAEAALGILADVVRNATFKQEEIDRLKDQRLDSLRVTMEQPGALARFVMDRVVFGSSGYGHPAGGTMETVQAINRDDLVTLYKTYYTPANATFILAGDLTMEQGAAYARQFFGDWKGGPPAKTEPVHLDAAEGKAENVVVDMPGAGQAAVALAMPAVRRDASDYYAGLIANAALGTGFVSRLNREIRIKRGLSYGAGSVLDARREGGAFFASAQTKNSSAAEVATLILAEIKRLGTEPVEGEELKSRQAVLTGGYARNLESNRGLVGQIASFVTYERPLETLNTFIPAINAIKAEDVRAFAEKHFDGISSLIIAGQAQEFMKPLQKDFENVRVIPQAALDLNRADLTKPKKN